MFDLACSWEKVFLEGMFEEKARNNTVDMVTLLHTFTRKKFSAKILEIANLSFSVFSSRVSSIWNEGSSNWPNRQPITRLDLFSRTGLPQKYFSVYLVYITFKPFSGWRKNKGWINEKHPKTIRITHSVQPNFNSH